MKKTRKENKIEKENDNFYSKITYRIISQPIARLISNTKITPNQVSFLSIITAAFAGYFFANGDWKNLAIGYIFLQLTYILDHVDGDLSRLTAKASNFGRWVDEFTNKFHKFFFILGLSIGIFQTTWQVVYLVLGSIVIFSWFFAAYISETKKSALGKSVKNNKTKLQKSSPRGLVNYLRELPFTLIVNNIFGILILINMPKTALWFILIVSLNSLQQIYSTRRRSFSL